MYSVTMGMWKFNAGAFKMADETPSEVDFDLDRKAQLAVKLTLGNMAMEGLYVSPEARLDLLNVAKDLLRGISNKKEEGGPSAS